MNIAKEIIEGKHDKELAAIYKAVNERYAYWTPERLAAQAMKALKENPETPEEHMNRLKRIGLI